MRAMLVAAGFGTRLHPLTSVLPKPAVPVGNRPIAWFGADHLARAGFDELVVNTHHLAPRLRQALLACAPPGVRLRFVHEPRILGTGGGVRNAFQPDDGRSLLTWNAKLLFQPDLGALLRAHEASGAIATMLLRPMPPQGKFAPVLVDAEGRVRALRAPSGATQPGLSARMFTGVQVLHPRAHVDLPAEGDIIEHAYLPWIARGELVASVCDTSPWFDVGVSLRHYLDANLALLGGTVRWPGMEPDAGANLIADDAQVEEGARLAACAVGQGAVITRGVALERVVVWPGSIVTQSASDAVITPDGVFPVG